jgi:hypothetical protein
MITAAGAMRVTTAMSKSRLHAAVPPALVKIEPVLPCVFINIS